MNKMNIAGLLLVVIGIIAGLWMGVWWAFIGGIVQIIGQVQAEHVEVFPVAFGVCRIVFSSLIGWVTCFLFIVPGLAMLSDD